MYLFGNLCSRFSRRFPAVYFHQNGPASLCLEAALLVSCLRKKRGLGDFATVFTKYCSTPMSTGSARSQESHTGLTTSVFVGETRLFLTQTLLARPKTQQKPNHPVTPKWGLTAQARRCHPVGSARAPAAPPWSQTGAPNGPAGPRRHILLLSLIHI